LLIIILENILCVNMDFMVAMNFHKEFFATKMLL
jgi:hypothetical protein